MSEKRYSVREIEDSYQSETYLDWCTRHGRGHIIFTVESLLAYLSSLSQETECSHENIMQGSHGVEICIDCKKYNPSPPHLDRKIEPLDGNDRGVRGLVWFDHAVMPRKAYDKINELVERFNQLQEVRRP